MLKTFKSPASLFKITSLALMLIFSVNAQAQSQQKTKDTNPQVLIETSEGNILIELYADKAPISAKNFLTYVNERFYDGTIFHRVIPTFMVQAGGFNKELQKKKTHKPIKNEANNGLLNSIGTISMARTSDPQSATAQFFINTNNNSSLDFRDKTAAAWGYAVFGRVIQGMKTVNKIRNQPTTFKNGMGDVPTKTILINKARRVK
jgi:peptidyl-prolyl cis-trans isomerase B (cyclophilin B)